MNCNLRRNSIRECSVRNSLPKPIKISISPFLESAAKERLYETLGFDEGRVYYKYLIGDSGKLNKEFSYSKRYRILKELFKKGAIAKYRTPSKETFTYLVLPPAFLIKNNTHDEVLEFLEALYYKEFNKQWKGFMEFAIVKENWLVSSILKNFTEHKAEVITTTDLKEYLSKEMGSKLIIRGNNSTKNTIGLIDNKIFFEFTKPFDDFSEESSGYIAFTESIESKDMIVKIKNRMQSLIYDHQ